MNKTEPVKIISNEEIAIKMLEEKYDEKFEVCDNAKLYFMNGYYTVQAYPVNRPEIVFMASGDFEGTGLSDNYYSKLFCLNLSDQVAKNMDGLSGFYYIFTVPLVENTMITDPEMSPEEYMKKWTKAKFNIYINYCPDNEDMSIDIDEFYTVLNHALDDLECISGCIALYIADEGTIQKMQQYVESNDKCYYDYITMTDPYYLGDIEFKLGKIRSTKEDISNMLNNRKCL